MSDNVLLHLGEEPRFDQIKPRHQVRPANCHRRSARTNRRHQSANAHRLGKHRRKTDRHYRTRRPHLERGFPSQLRGRYARAACRIQRIDARNHHFLHRNRSRHRVVQPLQNHQKLCRIRHPLPGTANQAQPRLARFRPQRCRIATRTAGRTGATANRRRATGCQIRTKHPRRDRRFRHLL